MAPRANWKGFLRLSLVSCPIALYPASSFSEKVSFNRVNRKTGNRLKQQNIDSETGDVVSREHPAHDKQSGQKPVDQARPGIAGCCGQSKDGNGNERGTNCVDQRP